MTTDNFIRNFIFPIVATTTADNIINVERLLGTGFVVSNKEGGIVGMTSCNVISDKIQNPHFILTVGNKLCLLPIENFNHQPWGTCTFGIPRYPDGFKN